MTRPPQEDCASHLERLSYADGSLRDSVRVYFRPPAPSAADTRQPMDRRVTNVRRTPRSPDQKRLQMQMEGDCDSIRDGSRGAASDQLGLASTPKSPPTTPNRRRQRVVSAADACDALRRDRRRITSRAASEERERAGGRQTARQNQRQTKLTTKKPDSRDLAQKRQQDLCFEIASGYSWAPAPFVIAQDIYDRYTYLHTLAYVEVNVFGDISNIWRGGPSDPLKVRGLSRPSTTYDLHSSSISTLMIIN